MNFPKQLIILVYEVGEVFHNWVYGLIFPHLAPSYFANAQAELCDCIRMIEELCERQGWNFDEMRGMGKERQEERKKTVLEKGGTWSDD